jgi:predicted permease
MAAFFRRIYYLLNRRRFDRELENDMEFHREMAAREGRRNFGNMLRLREQAREAWGWTWIDRLLQDLRYAARMLARSPGFTLTAVLVLAIGIGVNVSAFSFFNTMVLKPLPVSDPGTLVRLQRRSPENVVGQMPYPSATFYRDHAKSLSAVIAVMSVRPMLVDNGTERERATFVTSNYFTELGISADLGRLINPTPEAAPVVVLSHEFWQRRFGADPAIVGKTVHLNGRQATVIGIAPYAFPGLGDQRAAMWLPIEEQPYFVENSNVLTDSSTNSVRMYARLAPGVSAKMAEQELLSLTNELRRQHPKEIWDREYIHSDPGGYLQVMQPEMRPVVAMVAMLALLILAVACANLGGLMLARGVTREHEIGIRIAIGAGKGRIFRQLFTESLVLASLGSLAGIVVSYAVLRAALRELDAPIWLSAAPDWRVLLFVVGMTLAAAVFFGLAPAWMIARQQQRKTMARQILVGTQIASSCVLLIVASLLVRAVHHALYTDPGFGYERTLSIDPELGQHGYTPTAARAYLEQMQGRLRAIPGVTSSSLVRLPPLGRTVSRIGTEIGGQPVDIYPNWVTPEYFGTMSIPLLMGRNLLPGEKNVVVVSKSLAIKEWPGENPLGKLFTTGGRKDTVVGVVGNARVNAINDDDAVELYWTAQNLDMPEMSVIVKTRGAPEDLSPLVKSIAGSLDPKLFPEIQQIKSLFHENVSYLERIAMAASLVGTVAMLLAAVGIIGLVAFTVSQRMKEIAIRLALGARHVQVLTAVLGQFRWPVTLGIMMGVGFAAGTSKVLRKALYGVSNLDPVSYATAIAVLVAIVAIAALLPARRALRVDLAKILHYE